MPYRRQAMEDHDWGCAGWRECGTNWDPVFPAYKLHSEEELLEMLEDGGPQNPLRSVAALDLSGCGISIQGLMDLVIYINTYEVPLIQLDLSQNGIEDAGADTLSGGLVQKLGLIELKNNRITDEGCRSLSAAMRSQDCGLLYLGLYGNPITTTGRRHLWEAASNSVCRLKGLNLGAAGQSISFSGLRDLLEFPLQTLSLCSLVDDLTDPIDPGHLLNVQSPFCSITRLELAGNLLADYSVQMLIHAISSQTSQIRHLDLENNILSKVSFEGLVAGLASPNCKVACLMLSRVLVGSRKIGNGEVQHLVTHALMSGSCKINTLLLCGNQFGDEGLIALQEFLQLPNCKLLGLDIRRNPYTEQGIHTFRTQLAAAVIESPSLLACKCHNHNQDENLLFLTNEFEETGGRSTNVLVQSLIEIYVQIEMPNVQTEMPLICLNIDKLANYGEQP